MKLNINELKTTEKLWVKVKHISEVNCNNCQPILEIEMIKLGVIHKNKRLV